MTAPLAEELARRGFDAWNIEYRRVGQGSWPATLEDCAAAVDRLAGLERELSLDLGSVVVLGHSAGGQLAVWAAAQAAQPPVQGAVAVAGVLDLQRAAWMRIGDDAVVQFLGGDPDHVRERFLQADPIGRLPIGVSVRCVHSPDDERVPFEQSARYVEAAERSGDDAELIEVGGAHADGIDPGTPAGERVIGVLERMVRA